MKNAELVTFGGSSLDRVAHLRGDQQALSYHEAEYGACAVVLWRGKPLLSAPNLDRLARLPVKHPILKNYEEARVLLGRDEAGALIYGYDLSDWTPKGLDASELDRFVDITEQSYPDLCENAVFAELRRVMTWLDARDAELAATARAILGWHDSHKFCARCGHQSQPLQSGWQRSCPSCGGQHFPRTDPVVIMLITLGNKVLLGRSPGWPGGMYSLLAGFVEAGETMEAAVRREVFEEAGIAVGQVTYLSSQPWPFPASLMLGCRGQALSHEITIDPNELEDALWVSRDEMLAAFAGQHPKLIPARKGAIAQFLLRNWLADTLE